jgi:hypothetical protein
MTLPAWMNFSLFGNSIAGLWLARYSVLPVA